MPTAITTSRRRHGCPLCGAPSDSAHTPFCSQGCQDRDLLNWLGDAYKVPGPPADDAGDEFGLDRLDSEA